MKTVANMTDREKANVAVIEKLNGCVNSQDYDAMDAFFAEDYRDRNPGWKIESVADLKKVIAAGHQSFDVHNELKWIIPSNNMVFVEVNNAGIHKSEVFGRPPTGRKTDMTTFEIYRFDEAGKIAERWVISDLVGLMKQLGASLPDGI